MVVFGVSGGGMADEPGSGRKLAVQHESSLDQERQKTAEDIVAITKVFIRVKGISESDTCRVKIFRFQHPRTEFGTYFVFALPKSSGTGSGTLAPVHEVQIFEPNTEDQMPEWCVGETDRRIFAFHAVDPLFLVIPALTTDFEPLRVLLGRRYTQEVVYWLAKLVSAKDLDQVALGEAVNGVAQHKLSHVHIISWLTVKVDAAVSRLVAKKKLVTGYRVRPDVADIRAAYNRITSCLDKKLSETYYCVIIRKFRPGPDRARDYIDVSGSNMIQDSDDSMDMD